MLCFGSFVDLFTFGQYFIRQAAAALVRGKKVQPTVMMIVVIPLDKQVDPFPCLIQRPESFGLIIRTILQRFEETFGVWIIIAHTWSAV